jgi:hypothetical protein
MSFCKRKALPPGPGCSCQAPTWPANRSPSRTSLSSLPHSRFTFRPPRSPGSGPRSLTTASLPAPLARPAHHPASANRRRCCDDWQARPTPPPASLWPAASRLVAPLSVARAGRVDTAVSRALAAGHSERSAETVSPAASSMDFEDGERRAGRAAVAGGREGGRRAACAGGLFTASRWPCGFVLWAAQRPRARPGALWSGSPTWGCGRPGALLSRGSA